MNSYYLINLLIYAAVDATACLGLNQQFGVAGITNFGFIIFQAAGGYTAAILALPTSQPTADSSPTSAGWNLPFPLPWIGAAVVGGLIALPFTFLVGRRLRGDFAAVGLLVTAVLLNLLVTNYRPLLNGDAGLSLIPQPLQGEYNPPVVRLPVDLHRRRDRRVRAACTCSSAGSPSRRTAVRCAPCETTTWSPTRWARTCSRCAPRCW